MHCMSQEIFLGWACIDRHTRSGSSTGFGTYSRPWSKITGSRGLGT